MQYRLACYQQSLSGRLVRNIPPDCALSTCTSSSVQAQQKDVADGAGLKDVHNAGAVPDIANVIGDLITVCKYREHLSYPLALSAFV